MRSAFTKFLFFWTFSIASPFIFSHPAYSQNWLQVADFPGTERDDGTVFIIGDTAYCGTGLNSGFAACSDFYGFDMSSGSWTPVSSLPPGEERQYALGFAKPGAGYIFGGIGSAYFNDLWEYNPVINDWTEKSSMPAAGRSGMAGFVIGNNAFIIGGKNSSNVVLDEVWSYDMINDTWQALNNLPFGSRWRASATAYNGKGYMIFGRDENNRFCNELYEYDPMADSWALISVFPASGRSYSSLNAIAGYLVAVAGIDTFSTSYNDAWTYNIASSTWNQINSIPANGRRGGICFAGNNSLYYTTGNDHGNVRLKETWMINNPVGIDENSYENSVEVFPNPAFETIHINYTAINKIIDIIITDPTGKIISHYKSSTPLTSIYIDALESGVYFIKISSTDREACIKFIKMEQ